MKNRLTGMIVGGAIADAIGIVSEMYPEQQFATPEDTLKVSIQPGYWGESTSTFLAMLLNFPSKEQFRRALTHPEYSPTGIVSNLDPATATFCEATTSSSSAVDSGALVRSSAITLLYFGNYSSMLYKTKVACSFTHKNHLCITACKLYVALMDAVLHGYLKKDIFKPEYYSNLDLSVSADIVFMDSDTDTGDDAINILRVAVQAFRNTNNYAEGLREIMRTSLKPSRSAAVYGQLAGAYYGITDIKQEWIECLQGKDMINRAIRKSFLKIIPG